MTKSMSSELILSLVCYLIWNISAQNTRKIHTSFGGKIKPTPSFETGSSSPRRKQRGRLSEKKKSVNELRKFKIYYIDHCFCSGLKLSWQRCWKHLWRRRMNSLNRWCKVTPYSEYRLQHSSILLNLIFKIICFLFIYLFMPAASWFYPGPRKASSRGPSVSCRGLFSQDAVAVSNTLALTVVFHHFGLRVRRQMSPFSSETFETAKACWRCLWRFSVIQVIVVVKC